jgi:hypothetical protein
VLYSNPARFQPLVSYQTEIQMSKSLTQVVRA